jgi:hypothetical protein
MMASAERKKGGSARRVLRAGDTYNAIYSSVSSPLSAEASIHLLEPSSFEKKLSPAPSPSWFSLRYGIAVCLSSYWRISAAYINGVSPP